MNYNNNTVVRTHKQEYEDGTSRIFEYNSADKMVKESAYTPDGQLAYYVLPEYDDKGEMTKESIYNPDGSLRGYLIADPIIDGKRRMTSYNPDGSMKGYFIYEYNSEGKIINWASYNPDGSLAK